MLKQKTIFPLINKLFEGNCLEYIKKMSHKALFFIPPARGHIKQDI